MGDDPFCSLFIDTMLNNNAQLEPFFKKLLFLKEFNCLSYTFIDRKREVLELCFHLHEHRVPALPQNTNLKFKFEIKGFNF